MSRRPLFRLSILPTVVLAAVKASSLGLTLAAASIATAVHADVTEVDETALAALLAGGATIVDVRREDEWRERGLLEGSYPLTFFDAAGRHDIDAWLDALGEIVTPDETVVLICAHGLRSRRIAELLDGRLGFTAVHNVTAGIEGWRDGGGAITPFVP